MEISCVYIPEINEQEEDIFMAFRDIAKIEHIEFVVHNRYARVVNGRSNSHDFDSDKTNETTNKKTKSKPAFGLNLSFKAYSALSRALNPALKCCRANSINKIIFLADKPSKVIKLI